MSCSKPKLLLIDNDDLTAGILKIFIGNKYQLDSVTNCLDALTKVKENDYDAFLIDIRLRGGIDGMETTKKLKEINNNKEKPYICVTAHCMKGDKEYFLANGLTHYLSKPFLKQELLTLIEGALKGE